MSPGRLRAAVLLASWVAVALAPRDAEAQQEEPVDSTEIRILERLRRLSRPPGYDSVLFVQDSVRSAALSGEQPIQAVTGPDSVTAELLRLSGYSLTEYQAAGANFASEDRTLQLTAGDEGRARVDRDGMRVEADSSITFDETTGRMRTVGDATFTPPEGDAVESVQMIYDLSEARGSATEARTEFSQGGANWKVQGDMPYAAQDSSYMSHARFTSCELDEPHYHFETDQIKIVGGRVMVAKGVRLYFGDVPVAWLPFIAQSLAQGRSSGLLTPRFSVNDIVRTSQGYRRRLSNVGFYWAMSDYSDALAAMDWFSDTFIGLTGSVQYRFNRQFLNGGINFRHYWRDTGSTELALSTNHSWQIDERTRMQISGNFTSSNDFVRENSLNPLEVTQSIDSNGGFNRRFDWGSVDLAVNRQQFLSDDRTTWTLPSLSVSLSPITLFRADPGEERFWNNMSWSGSSSLGRNTVTYEQPDTFSLSTANTVKTSGRASSSLTIGNLRFGQSVSANESKTLGVPEALLVQGDTASPDLLLMGQPARDIADANVTWSTSVDYQQQLIGSTTVTPRLSVSGNLLRSDTDSLASSFVSAPMRASFGATLKTDVYGFFPGFGSFEAIRHKLSPSFSYEWSPSSQPNAIQQQVFGSRALQPKNALSVTLNQTFEARRATDEASDTAQAADSLGLEDLVAPTRAGEPQRLPQAQTVKLLGLTTSVVRYDFVEADSVGSFLAGFQSTTLSNQITSDYLRGLSVSLNHELFDDSISDGGLERRFAPHLSGVNFSFSLGSSSSIFRWLGLTGGGDDEPEEPDEELADPFDAQGPTDESSMIPVGTPQDAQAEPRGRGGRGGWTANLSYSLQRPRDSNLPASQMLSGGLTLRPTENWDVSWRTAYDLERGAFNDHIVRLTRDLHRWQAHFDFLQTATGNWSFRFEVSLTDNRDLKFDYNQRNLDVGLPASQRR